MSKRNALLEGLGIIPVNVALSDRDISSRKVDRISSVEDQWELEHQLPHRILGEL